jgi:trk system potassium uptake protein
MNYSVLFKLLGGLLLFIGVSMVVPLLVAVYFDEGDVGAFAWSLLITVAVGGALLVAFRRAGGRFRRREAFAIVSLGWILCTAFGALPFVFEGTFPTLIDAYFETMSGFTTTGASVLTDIEAQTHAILFWRSMTHWFGGIGIIVLFMAVLPFLGVGGRELFFSEVPGPLKEGLRPRVKETAQTLVSIYISFCILLAILLRLGGMNWFDAWCHSFSTVATGGLSTRQASIGHFDCAYIEVIIMLFMFLCGANFSLYYMTLKKGNLRGFWRDVEFRYYVGITLFCTVMVTAQLWNYGIYDTAAESLRYGLFQVLAIITTTGFSTADFDSWPTLSKTVLGLLMIVGGCAGSTSGGMKIIRLVVIFKHAFLEVQRSFRPQRVTVLKMGRKIIDDRVRASIVGFFVLHMLIFGIGVAIMAGFEDMDLVTSTTAALATLTNIGPGLGQVGPTLDYSWIPPSGKVLLIFFMLLGRLELYAVLVLFMPSFWRKA